MSDTVSSAEWQAKEPSRPQTVMINKLQQDNSSEEDTTIGDAFFSKNKEDKSVDDNDLITKDQDTNGSQNEHGTDTSSPKVRPKTVTKQRTGGYQRCLVDIGAVESNTPVATQNQTLSPKPKSENCYICGKEFLSSSLKIHEKQCTKKYEKTSKINNEKSSKCNSKTSSKISKKPQLEACYLCGKEFFIHSLGIHETQCIKNWKADKIPDARDKRVSERTMIEKHYNGSAEETEVCAQTDEKSTKEEPHPLHALSNSELKSDNNTLIERDQSCSQKQATKPNDTSPKFEKTASPKQRKLKTVPCYSCGVVFLPNSLKIHEKKCKGNLQNSHHNDDTGNIVENDDVSSKPSVENVMVEETPENEDNPQSIDDTIDTSVHNASKISIPKKPATIMCYICGQEFLKSSYAFHEKKCAKKNEKAEEQPVKNNKVSNTQKTTKPKTNICYICGEHFLKSSYPFHEKKCSNRAEKVQETIPETTKANQSQVKNSYKPRTVICHTCDQEFLKSSYVLHEKQCNKNKVAEEESKSTKEKTVNNSQVERPQTPRRGPKTKPCYVCGKEILLPSLKVHEQQCQKKMDILKNINQQRSPAQSKKSARQSGAAKVKSENKPKTELCYICGENFLSSSIRVHEAQCEKRWNENA